MLSGPTEFPNPAGMAVLSRSWTTTPCWLPASAVIRRDHAAVLVDLEQLAIDRHRIEAMADDQGVAVEEQRYRCRCHNARVADILLLCRLLPLPESHPMHRFDATGPPKLRSSPPSPRSYPRGHPTQRRLPDEEILRLYVEEKLDSSTIGLRVECTSKTVLERNIPRI